jgi:hypothetical protein
MNVGRYKTNQKTNDKLYRLCAYMMQFYWALFLSSILVKYDHMY